MTGTNAMTIDAASLIAMPASSPSQAQLEAAVVSATQLCDEALGGEPYLANVWETDYGRLGAILIPVVDVKLFEDRQRTLDVAVKGVRLAAGLGAKCVSFTGMIPAATHYALDIADAVHASVGTAPNADAALRAIRLTTGHAAVVAAFALNIERLLDFAARQYCDERVAFVGLGSIGDGIARLLSQQAPPKHLHLVDVSTKRRQLEALRAFLARQPGYSDVAIDITTVEKNESVPESLYRSTTLFLCATSSANVIDIDRLEPGTLIVDDSFPLGFDARKAANRMETSGDIMITVAGGFQGPSTLTLSDEQSMSADPRLGDILYGFKRVANPWPDCMTGCVYSSLITPHFDLPETIGPVALKDAVRCYEILKQERFTGTPPYFVTFGFERPEPIFVIDKSALSPAASIGSTPVR